MNNIDITVLKAKFVAYLRAFNAVVTLGLLPSETLSGPLFSGSIAFQTTALPKHL